MLYVAHTIAIPSILEVGINKANNLGTFVRKKGFNNAVLFWGPGIKDMFGNPIMQSFTDAGLKIKKEYEDDNTDICSIIDKAFTLPSNTELIIGIGGGRVLDVAKYISFLNKIPFVSFPTSTSHDGFASSGCSLMVNNKRTSVPASMPYGIVVDIDIIKESPERFIFSGMGDLISKITAVYDWEYEDIMGHTTVDDFAVMIAKKSVNSVARVYFPSIKDDFFIKELVDSLTLSGIAMEIAGKSAPASGSEHLVSHALDKFSEKPQLHGIQVGIATYIMALVQDHRYKRVRTFLSDMGFFDFVKTLGLKKADFEKAIDIAPSVKPDRFTYIHSEENRKLAKSFLYDDPILNEILY